MTTIWLLAGVGPAVVVLLYASLVALHNARRFPRLSSPPPDAAAQRRNEPLAPASGPIPAPAVSILIPARNEARRIPGIIHDIRAQGFTDLELIILDDGSTDGTAGIARAACSEDGRCRIIDGSPPPTGWLGKNWACHQLAQHARGERLIFVDADVRWRPGALAALLHEQRTSGAGLLAVWPSQQAVNWSERLIVPLMAYILLAYLPVRWAHDPRMERAAAANGQCMVFICRAYDACGGHAAVRGSVLDDVALAVRIKRAGQPLRLVDGAGLVSCRMYTCWPTVLQGYGKNILAGHAGSPALLLLSTLLHLLVYVAPACWFLRTLPGGFNWTAAIALGLYLVSVGVRMLTAHTAGLRRRDAWLMPISILLMAAIALYAVWCVLLHGGPVWKGRRILTQSGTAYGE